MPKDVTDVTNEGLLHPGEAIFVSATPEGKLLEFYGIGAECPQKIKKAKAPKLTPQGSVVFTEYFRGVILDVIDPKSISSRNSLMFRRHEFETPLNDYQIEEAMSDGYAFTDPGKLLNVIHEVLTRPRRSSLLSIRPLTVESTVPNLFHFDRDGTLFTIALQRTARQRWECNAFLKARPQFPVGSQLFIQVP